MEMQELIEHLLAGQAKAEADREQMLAEIKADRKADQAEMRSTVCAIRSELKETIRVMRAATEPIWAELDGTTTCHEAMRQIWKRLSPIQE
jgi:hypothetical protein